MGGLGVFVVWMGYSLFYYGLDQVRGGNNGFLSLVTPGKYTNQTNDSGVGGTNANTSTSAAASGTATAPAPPAAATPRRTSITGGGSI
jgi:hypothetical protein